MPICPYLNAEERCSIYNARPECCRNFPHHNSPAFCTDAHRCIGNCPACEDKCCKNISVDKEGPLVPADFLQALNITCTGCTQVWK